MDAIINTLFVWVLPVAITLTGLYFAFRTEILRDAVTGPRTDFRMVPYSFARTQLLWWSVIIISCFCAYYGHNGLVFDLTNQGDHTYLYLLGISMGTTAAAKIIDNTDISQKVVRHQDANSSRGFLFDILSDDSGISVHRFQAVAFNTIFGLMFILHFLKKGTFLELGEFELGLMGISSAAYIGMKLNENASGKSPAGSSGAVDEENLRDIDESYRIASGKIEPN